MKNAHIIGVCGIAMSATARLLQEQGWTVSGSDNAFYPPASTYVEKLGITLSEGYSPNNIPADAELIVIGRNAELNPETNTEVQAALTSGVTIHSYPEVLQEITKEKDRIVVAGSYGKSTVTSLLSYILIHAGKEPGYFIGAQPEDVEYTSTIGAGNTFILEGDEYPTAHGDDRSKFLHYDPNTVLLTSVDHDHVNVFPTYEDYQKPFIELLEKMPSDGLLVACTDNDGVSAIGHHTDARVTTYGIYNDAIWTAHNISYGETTTFDLRKNGVHVATLTTKLLGAHNVQNIVGAAALLLEKSLVTVSELEDAVASFSGVKRRLNKITDTTSIPAYEGFGSSYEKARSAIEAMKLHFPEKKLLILFEPHTFSWRNRDTIDWYDTVFKEAVQVLLYHPPSQGADTHKQLTQDEIVNRIAGSGTPTTALTTKDQTHASLLQHIDTSTVLLILSSGNFGGILDTLPEWLNKNT